MSDQDDTQDTEVVETEEQQEVDQAEEPQEGSGDLEEVDLEEAANWDAERALKKIRKLNNEIRSVKERAKQGEEASKEATTLRAQVAREKVARRLGLADNETTDEFLSRLKGDTVDDLMEDAERLLSLVTTTTKRPPTTRPTERLRGGGAPDEEPEETDLAKLGARMFRR